MRSLPLLLLTWFACGQGGRAKELALGQECQDKSECGINSNCEGTPPVCTCKGGYVDENGRCGRKIGKSCKKTSQCVRNTYCNRKSGVCSGCLYSGYVQMDGICVKKHQCSYYIKRANVEKFYSTITPAAYFYNVFPCRAKLAHFQCAGAEVEVSVKHGVTTKTNFYAKESTGGVYVSDIIVNVTSVNDDGTVTSQINSLDTNAFAKYLRKGDFSITPWIWSYEGTKKPRRKQRVIGTYKPYRAEVTMGELRVSYSDKYQDLDIECYGPGFKRLASPGETVCGFPGDSDSAMKKELEGKSTTGQSVTNVLDPYIVLAKQDCQQSNQLCEEAKTVLNGKCPNLGGSMYKCGELYSTKWTLNLGRCMRQNSIDSFQVYVACLKVLCGVEGGKSKENCDLFQKVLSTCGNKRGNYQISTLISNAQCSDDPSSSQTA